MTMLLIAVPVVYAGALFVVWSFCRAAAIGDEYLAVLDDVHCPHCDGIDVYDWGDGDWWSCHTCQVMFQTEAS